MPCHAACLFPLHNWESQRNNARLAWLNRAWVIHWQQASCWPACRLPRSGCRPAWLPATCLVIFFSRRAGCLPGHAIEKMAALDVTPGQPLTLPRYACHPIHIPSCRQRIFPETNFLMLSKSPWHWRTIVLFGLGLRHTTPSLGQKWLACLPPVGPAATLEGLGFFSAAGLPPCFSFQPIEIQLLSGEEEGKASLHAAPSHQLAVILSEGLPPVLGTLLLPGAPRATGHIVPACPSHAAADTSSIQTFSRRHAHISQPLAFHQAAHWMDSRPKQYWIGLAWQAAQPASHFLPLFFFFFFGSLQSAFSGIVTGYYHAY